MYDILVDSLFQKTGQPLNIPWRITVVHKTICIKLALCFLLLAGCAPMTENAIKQKGWTALSSKQIFELVADNSLHLHSSGFDGKLFMKKDGRLAAKDYSNNKDSGHWDVNKEDRLCLKFRAWNFGDIKCYSVYAKEGSSSYRLTTANGAIHYTARVIGGDAARLGNRLKPSNENQYLRKELAGETDSAETVRSSSSTTTSYKRQRYAPPKEELEQTVKNLAKNCPGCNLAGADLTKASLIGAQLEGAKLKGADLTRANLRRAKLRGANLSGALLINTNLPGADLRDCDLHGANLSGANLIRADLTGADTAGAIFTGALLEGVKGYQEKP